jgi:hypothetical protein
MSVNPFSRYLRQWSQSHALDEFVAYWDALEYVVVSVYREKQTAVAAAPEFSRVWPWLRRHYPHWQASLTPFWQLTTVAGAPAPADPFQLLLDLDSPERISGNWEAMQVLPAAREALNRFILAQSQ